MFIHRVGLIAPDSVSTNSFPQIESTRQAVSGSIGSSTSYNMPTGTVAGDLVVMIVGVRKTPAAFGLNGISTPSGWTSLVNTTHGTNTRLQIFYQVRTINGGSVTLANSAGASGDNAIMFGVTMYRITSHSTDIGFPLVAATTTGGSGNPNSPNRTVPAEWGTNPQILWLSCVASYSNTAAQPANFGDRLTSTYNSGSSYIYAISSHREFQTSVGLDPGAYTTSSSSWVASTVAIRGL